MNNKVEILDGIMGGGKALRDDAKLYSSEGVISIGDCKVGDKIYGEDGELHTILGKYPQGEKELYKVVFSDGNEVICCADHLWTYQHPQDVKVGRFRTSSLKEIISKDLFKQTNKCKNWQFFIPVTKPVNFNKTDLKIDPYLLGLLLGDGSFLHNVSFTNSEVDICEKFESKVDAFRKYKSRNTFEYRIKKSSELFGNLKSLCLTGLKSEHKFIPNDYKYGSIEDRFALLQGLIDSDGFCAGSYFEYYTSSEALAVDIKELSESLGCVVTHTIKENVQYTYTGEVRKGLPSHRLFIRSGNLGDICSSLKHKGRITVSQRKPHRTIRDIVPVGKSSCTCIEVSNPTKLFLTNGFIPTHNTTSVLKWIDNNPEERYIFVSPLLSEVGEGGRIHRDLKYVSFDTPSSDSNTNKSEDLLTMLSEGCNIACTHSLYLNMEDEHFKLIKDLGYIVIIDEEVNVIENFNSYSGKDLEWLINNKHVEISETDGMVKWINKEGITHGHKYYKMLCLCESESLYVSKRSLSMMVTHLPTKLFDCAKRVIIITYMFKGNVLDKFLSVKGIESTEFTEVILDKSKEDKENIRNLLNIIPPSRKTEDLIMSSTWYKTKCSTDNLKAVENYIRNTCLNSGLSSDEIKWCVPKFRAFNDLGERRTLIKPHRFIQNSKGESLHLSANVRATNDYGHVKLMIHCYNRYPQSSIEAYLSDYGHTVSREIFAVSELVQWAWRGCIRNNQPMTLAVGSKRMYNLFMKWLNS